MCIDLDYYSSYSYALYYSWYRHGTVLLGHAVVDATEVWLDPTDNRAHNRVVSTLIWFPNLTPTNLVSYHSVY